MNLLVRTAPPLVVGSALSAAEQDRISRAMLARYVAALAVAIRAVAAALLIPPPVPSSRIGLLDCLVAELVGKTAQLVLIIAGTSISGLVLSVIWGRITRQET